MCAQLSSTQLREMMNETWDRSDVLDLSPAMYPPEFMWAGEGEYDLEIEERVIQEHFNETVSVLDGGLGYDTLSGMKERLDVHHSRAEEAATRFESRRNYARLQVAAMKEKVLSIAQEREGENSDDAVVERGNQILDEPMGKHWKTEDGAVRMTEAPTEEWFVMASGYNPDEHWEENGEIPLSDISINFRPEKGDWAIEFTEDHLRPTDKRLFDGDETWRDALESIRRRGKNLEESYEQARQTRELLRFRRAVIETVLYRFEAYGSVEQMTEEEAQEIASEQDEEGPPIPGYRGAEYAIEAKEVLEETPITTFSALEREMEEPTVGGGSKVDTVKRNIGYDDLPKEEKGFSRFREMVARKVKQLEGED